MVQANIFGVANRPQRSTMEYSNTIIETLLYNFKPAIGNDLEKYRNHVYRVFLNCLIMDKEKNNEEKYAVVAVFHDIGIWTDHTIDYLDPSVGQLSLYLTGSGKQEWVDECSRMINWHHKTTSYTGPFKQTVEIFRKADWIDVSLGLLTYGFDRRSIRENRQKLPNRGFHLFLLKKLAGNFFRHPLNPLPMFKW
jgi:hypothetical protein